MTKIMTKKFPWFLLLQADHLCGQGECLHSKSVQPYSNHIHTDLIKYRNLCQDMFRVCFQLHPQLHPQPPIILQRLIGLLLQFYLSLEDIYIV